MSFLTKLNIDRKTNDKTTKITSISCICINRNNENMLVCEKNWYLLHVYYMTFLKNNNTIGKSSNQKSTSSVSIHSLSWSFTERFYLFVNIPSLTCNIHSLTGVNSLFV